uniref:Transducin beta-like protein 3 n=1 Tax=Sus scrofa TaxID=9823 RepID=A0A8D1ZP92_PIG
MASRGPPRSSLFNHWGISGNTGRWTAYNMGMLSPASQLRGLKKVMMKRPYHPLSLVAPASLLLSRNSSTAGPYGLTSGRAPTVGLVTRDQGVSGSCSPPLLSSYAIERKIEPFYKGGKVQLDQTGQHLFCVCGTRVNILDVASGAVLRSLEQEDQEDITAFDLSPDDEVLVTATRALLLAQWAWREGSIVRLWKAIHTAPVAAMAFDPTSTLLATGGCDGAVRVWDVVRHYGTHHFRGSPGVVHLVAFHPDPARLLLFSSAADASIRVWSLQDRSCLAVLTAHYSAVTSVTFSADGYTMISSGRDKICTVWDLQSLQATKTVPVFESVEAAVLLPEEPAPELGVKSTGLHFLTAGDQGILRVWEAASGQCVHAQPRLPGPGQELTHCALARAAGLLLSVTADHNLLLYEARSLQLQKQFAGYSEEVLDVRFLGPENSHVVVASNSPCLKVFELQTSACQILHGHTDIVLALDVFRKGWLFASCAKDQSIRIWRINKAGLVACVAQGSGHTHSVGTICCSRLKESFLVTGSQDCTVKLWPLPEALPSRSTAPDSGPVLLQAQATQRCHDKDINSVAIAPNDKLLATGSQDRTAKLWALPQCQLLGIFSGHRRGLWCVQFSPMDQVLATASADGTVKLWALQDFSCLKTFEGHDASVLRVAFVSRGTQLLSSGSDGLVKLWTIKSNECVRTLDAHEDKVWGLHCSRLDDRALTAASDSRVILWKDVTEEEQAEEEARREEEVVRYVGSPSPARKSCLPASASAAQDTEAQGSSATHPSGPVPCSLLPSPGSKNWTTCSMRSGTCGRWAWPSPWTGPTPC